MKILFIIAPKNFKDEEYFKTKEVLEKNRFCIDTVSAKPGLAQGVDGGQVDIKRTIDQINLSDYGGLIIIGGPGALKYLDNEEVYQFIRQAKKIDKFIIAAICIAPVILAHTNEFFNKRMTVWSTPLQKWGVRELETNKIDYVDRDVVVDGPVITANGPKAAEAFGSKISEVLDNLSKKD